MYETLKKLLLQILCVPEEPHDPMGDVAQLRVFRAAPGYLKYLRVSWMVFQAVILLGLGVVELALVVAVIHSGRHPLGGLLAGALGLAILVFGVLQFWITHALLRLNYELRWYKITDRSLRLRQGVCTVHELTLTFANIQNINVTQGPLERYFGISNVRVETAGGGGVAIGPHGEPQRFDAHQAIFRGVDNPQEIRDIMLTHLRKLKGAGLGDPDDSHPAPHTQPAPIALEPLLAELRDEARSLRQAASALRRT